jgi:hypothetical protein
VTIRILAEREPYAASLEASRVQDPAETGPLPGALLLLYGPGALDGPEPDVLAMRARDFLDLPEAFGRSSSNIIAFGPVGLMSQAFERGCLDYMREPFSIPELRARVGRLSFLRIRIAGGYLRLRGSRLEGQLSAIELQPGPLSLFRLLAGKAPFPVSKEAASAVLRIAPDDRSHALGRAAVSLRRGLDLVQPGAGRMLRAIRGVGYRLNATRCG